MHFGIGIDGGSEYSLDPDIDYEPDTDGQLGQIHLRPLNPEP